MTSGREDVNRKARMVGFLPARVGAVAGVVLGCPGLWRTSLVIRHYRASIGIVNDPSIRELAQVTALVELGLAAVLFAHAVAAVYVTRRCLHLHAIVVVAVGTVAGVLVAGAFWQTPFLGMPGLLPASLILSCALTGYFTDAPWASVYLGALAGSLLGLLAAAPSSDPMIALAVVAPQVTVAFVGAAFGSGIRRLRPPRRHG